MSLRVLLALPSLNLVESANVDLTTFGMADQGIPTLLAVLSGAANSSAFHWLWTAVVGVGLLVWCFSSPRFRARPDQIFAGVCVGSLIVVGWYITGRVGTDEFEPTPLQSFSFVAPVADSLQY